MKRIGIRLATLVPLSLLAACSEQEISRGIENGVKTVLWAIAKVILISLGLIVAWTAALAVGGVLIALGVRRTRVDGGALILFALGGGTIVAAWPLVFSPSGLAGTLAPGSTDGIGAGPVVGQFVAVVLAIVLAVVLVRRHRRSGATRLAATPLAPPPPPAPAAPPVPPPPPPRPVDRAPSAPKSNASRKPSVKARSRAVKTRSRG